MACDPPAQLDVSIALYEEHVIALGENAVGLRQVSDAALGGPGELLVLDFTSRRLHILRHHERASKSVRLRDLFDGTWPALVAYDNQGTIYLLSDRSSACRMYSSDLEPLDDCSLPFRFSRVTQAFFVGNRLVVVGRRPHSPRSVHLFTPDLTHVTSFGIIRHIEVATDSLVLNWGLGIAAPAGREAILYASLNPFSIYRYSRDGSELSRTKGRVKLIRAERVARVRVGRERHLTDVFDRTVGVVSLGSSTLHMSYSPNQDVTSLRLLGPDDRVFASADMPFFMRPIAPLAGQSLYMLRDVNGLQLVRYRFELQAPSRAE